MSGPYDRDEYTSHAGCGAGPEANASGAGDPDQGVGQDVRPRKDAPRPLKQVDLDVAEREFLCIVGASGCGKSTLLNLIAGLDKPTRGHDRDRWTQGRVHVPGSHAAPLAHGRPERRPGAQAERCPEERAPGRVEELLALVHLGGRQHRRPHELSGGMRQRTALARVLAQEADIVLMDEPFAALDAMTRDHARRDRADQAELGLTIVFVTHNVREAVRLGDRTVLFAARRDGSRRSTGSTCRVHAAFDSPGWRRCRGQLTDELKAGGGRHVALIIPEPQLDGQTSSRAARASNGSQAPRHSP